MAQKRFTQAWKGTGREAITCGYDQGTPALISDITANVHSTAKGHYYLMTYSWMKEDVVHEGVFLFGGDGKTASASWGDSFHMQSTAMQCQGEILEDGEKLVVTGSYAVEEGPAWGWRTELSRQGPDSMLMEAYNITPDGLEGLAVQAELNRVN